MEAIGKGLIGLGVSIAVLGVLCLLLAKIPGARIGRLPGDIVIEREGFSLYAPLTSGLLISLVLTAILTVLRLIRK